MNLPVKYVEIFSPRDAFSAISSADTGDLDVLGIALLLLFGRLPGSDQTVILSIAVLPYLANNRTKASAAPANCAELLRIVVLPVDQVGLIEDFLRLLQADAVFLFYRMALLSCRTPRARHEGILYYYPSYSWRRDDFVQPARCQGAQPTVACLIQKLNAES